jgi:uncharacterized protein DUF4332
MILLTAVAVLALATAGLALLIEPIPGWYYTLAWWSYILAVDDLNRRLGGRSLLRDRFRHLAYLAYASVLWWTLFEIVNLRLGNWYYVMSPAWRPLRWASGVVAFATVLPAIVVTVTLIESLGWLRTVRVTPVVWSPRKRAVVLALGTASVVLPLAWPDVFYPLIWGAVIFLVEPWNRDHAPRSFLRDLEQGEAGPFVRTLAAGLVCGGLWELWNYWARTKWVYTVPGFEDVKMFEMPLLGFLGFPPFAVECLVLLRLLGAVGDRLPARGRARARLAAAVLGPAAIVAMFASIDRVTVDSLYASTAELSVLPAGDRSRMASAGLRSPELVLRRLRTDAGRAEWAVRTGIDAATLRAHFERTRLVMHRGIGDGRAAQLAEIGVRRVEDLDRWTAEDLAARLRTGDGRDRFLQRRVRTWRTRPWDAALVPAGQGAGPGGSSAAALVSFRNESTSRPTMAARIGSK